MNTLEWTLILNNCWIESSPSSFHVSLALTFFHLENALTILGTIRSKKQLFSHSWPEAFLKNKSLYSHCWAQSGTVSEVGFFPPPSTFPQAIPKDFSASTQAMSWCSCTVLYQPNMCPPCPADLHTFEGRTALHSCFGQSVGWFVCILFHYEKTRASSFL